jgi:hypothetical protein
MRNIIELKVIARYEHQALLSRSVNYSDFQSYKVHLSPLIASDEGVGGGVLVPGLMTICCSFVKKYKEQKM